MIGVWSLFLAASAIYPNNLFARMPELKCKELIELPDYDNPIYLLSKKIGGQCPKGFDEIDWEGLPCRQFLKFATKTEEIPVECPKRGRRNTKASASKGT